MDAYIYRADLWCEACISEIYSKIVFPSYADLKNEGTWDSDDYPKGPYANGGGEAQSANYCRGCDASLENPVIEEETTND